MRCLAIGKQWLVPAVFLLGATAPALAGPPANGVDLSLPGTPALADGGKPAIGGAPAASLGPDDAGGCAPPLPCGTRLYGTVRRNGAIELQVPAWRW